MNAKTPITTPITPAIRISNHNTLAINNLNSANELLTKMLASTQVSHITTGINSYSSLKITAYD